MSFGCPDMQPAYPLAVQGAVVAEVKGVMVHGLPPAAPADGDYPDELTEHFGFQAQVCIGGVGNDLADSFDIRP